ncbi:hypothetical protein WJT74_07350 [Sphingomicrobium sp. XHP0239]|uniref:hypothetical protein n=1 Tax=Sphingomicrobium maritimum TaxID=3133972 RepID=UPI0031CCD522
MAQLNDPKALPLMPVGCWAVPLGLVIAAIIFGNDGFDPSWVTLTLGVVFGLFGYAYGERAFMARRRGEAGFARRQWYRAFIALALAGLFLSLWFFSR